VSGKRKKRFKSLGREGKKENTKSKKVGEEKGEGVIGFIGKGKGYYSGKKKGL